MLQKNLHCHLWEPLIQRMSSELLQFLMVEIHALQQLATPGFEHLTMKVTWGVQCCWFLVFQLPMKMPELQFLLEQVTTFQQ